MVVNAADVEGLRDRVVVRIPVVLGDGARGMLTRHPRGGIRLTRTEETVTINSQVATGGRDGLTTVP